LIRGKDKDSVEKISSCLSIFVTRSKSICPWLSEQLKMTLLAEYQIIGVPYNIIIPFSISSISTIFDIEEETLIAPQYKRGYIQPILLQHSWKCEELYLTHVHSILFELGMYSSYYYHLNFVEDNDNSKTQLKNEFFKKLQIQECDMEIIKYFADVVKKQHSSRLSGMKEAPRIRIDYSEVFLFRKNGKSERYFE